MSVAEVAPQPQHPPPVLAGAGVDARDFLAVLLGSKDVDRRVPVSGLVVFSRSPRLLALTRNPFMPALAPVIRGPLLLIRNVLPRERLRIMAASILSLARWE